MKNKSLRNLCVLVLTISILLNAYEGFGQDVPQIEDSSYTEKVKKGWNFGGLPSILYNTDIGFQYGLLVNVFNYGDGSTYPEYKHQFYAEWSRTTKGGGINQFFYDSKYLLPNKIRTTFDVSYLTEKALDFYGFNGYEATYFPFYEDEGFDEYNSRMYYRMQRKMLRIALDLQGSIVGQKLRWVAGAGYMDTKISTVDIETLNKGKDEQDQLPDVNLLYDNYVDWGILTPDERDGGTMTWLKAGLVFDSRDNEPNPMKGIWTEAILISAPSFLGNKIYAFNRFAVTHRQYFTLVKERLSFAYRLSYQGSFGGKMPFYLQSIRVMSFQMSTVRDGLGGSRTVRGIKRNRVVGDGMGLGNVELRWKFFRTYFLKQNFYFSFNVFMDGGMVFQKHEFSRDGIPPEEAIEPIDDSPHLSSGLGIRIAMNQNFVIAVDYGSAFDARDGNSGLYINLGFLF